jgi:hypothetical protein
MVSGRRVYATQDKGLKPHTFEKTMRHQEDGAQCSDKTNKNVKERKVWVVYSTGVQEQQMEIFQKQHRD